MLRRYCKTGGGFNSYLFTRRHIMLWSDGLAQWLKRWTGDPKDEGSNTSRAQEKR